MFPPRYVELSLKKDISEDEPVGEMVELSSSFSSAHALLPKIKSFLPLDLFLHL